MGSILGILQSYGTWLTANPTEKLIAAQRITICQGCEHWGGIVCKLCGCPTKVKVFHHDKNECPEKKWTV